MAETKDEQVKKIVDAVNKAEQRKKKVKGKTKGKKQTKKGNKTVADETVSKETTKRTKSKNKIKGMAKKVAEELKGTIKDKNEVDKTLDLYDTIKESPLRKVSNPDSRSNAAKKFIESELDGQTINKNGIHPGMLMTFQYNMPKTKDKLEYYDANPCVIFFGEIKTTEGKRVLGFNLHYYPPVLRYKLMDWIFDTFKSYFLKKWDSDKTQNIGGFSYPFITNALNKAKLDFGIREYIPQLMTNVKKVPPKYFQVAVFTEGQFMKETRQQILSYWKGKGQSF